MHGQPDDFSHALLQGARNFRAVKSYKAGAGRLRANTIFRSGELSQLTEVDRVALAALGIKLVCDLRSTDERSEYPTNWPSELPTQTAPVWLDLPDRDESEAGPAKIFDLILAHQGDGAARKAMHTLYRRKPLAFAPALRLIFSHILGNAGLPVLIHCHVGKDRTGFVTAMLLAAIGVAKTDILDDYVTTAIFAPPAQGAISLADWAKRAFDRNIAPEQARPIVEANPAYLEAAFDQITADWGDVDQYLAKAAGLDPVSRDRLNEKLSEAAAFYP